MEIAYLSLAAKFEACKLKSSGEVARSAHAGVFASFPSDRNFEDVVPEAPSVGESFGVECPAVAGASTKDRIGCFTTEDLEPPMGVGKTWEHRALHQLAQPIQARARSWSCRLGKGTSDDRGNDRFSLSGGHQPIEFANVHRRVGVEEESVAAGAGEHSLTNGMTLANVAFGGENTKVPEEMGVALSNSSGVVGRPVIYDDDFVVAITLIEKSGIEYNVRPMRDASLKAGMMMERSRTTQPVFVAAEVLQLLNLPAGIPAPQIGFR